MGSPGGLPVAPTTGLHMYIKGAGVGGGESAKARKGTLVENFIFR